uniref:DNA-directed RNA polymerase subunit beta'' n=1 Tax=Nephroselmis olivacea TaxID=31312 RepID=RPOC2_NEPOL|nr:RNA polymerase beta'' chain [Nephroselmis olivacea]Q9TL04.1 RecName: Full=DNA-directed RNA polymerase subunit beta''; AltName: Full=PEP; AltName: Full=Plastid-encoded RNA polymerase subunit beta''; Short=RNA polymerase subunit beta'' [Nephroselmis olivacea]AAD54812.1 beta'' subunit of RNA polymerase [Nephroselmis olivacea]
MNTQEKHQFEPVLPQAHDDPTLSKPPIFFNRTADKGMIKRLIAWFLVHYGLADTVSMIEDLKQVGFQYATRAGISLGIEDLRIPPTKPRLLQEAHREINRMEFRYQQGYVSLVERFQKVIDTWNGTSELLKDDVVENFLATDPLNPVYMMAFSGARGNLSQVRQLVGMRGLMSNPQGEIIDLPIRSNFREGLTVTEYIISCYGARKGLVDTALRTANSGYLTRRLVDVAQDIVIRMTSCSPSAYPLISFTKSGKEVVYPLEERLLGRVLAIGAFNQEGELISGPDTAISQEIAVQLMDCDPKEILVRSVLLCKSKRGLCRLCYGWNLGTGTIVSIGEAVGIIAAQSIGEPGTQLTMRTFHTGGVFAGGVTNEIRAPHAGLVHYPRPIHPKWVRTRHGQFGILISEKIEIIFEHESKKTIQVFDAGTVLTIHEGEKVHTNQLIGEIPAHGTLVTGWRSLKSGVDGEVRFDELELLKQRPRSDRTSPVRLDPRVCNKAHLWILQGHVNTFEMPIQLVANIGDKVEKDSIVSTTKQVVSEEGRIIYRYDEKRGKEQTIITHAFGSVQFDGVDAWLPTKSQGIKQSIRTTGGKLSISSQGMTLSATKIKQEGIGSFDWPALAEPSIEEDEELEEAYKKTKDPIIQPTPYPLQYCVLPEQKYVIQAQEGWIISVLGGQSVGASQSLATYVDSQWEVEQGQLSIRSIEYRVHDQSWIQVITPSLVEIESGRGSYHLMAKAGWIIPISTKIRCKDYRLISGSILLGKWSLPISRFAVEQAASYPAILIRPIHTYPVYPTTIWDETINWQRGIASIGSNDWHPRCIAPTYQAPSYVESFKGRQTFTGEEKQEGNKPVEITSKNRRKSAANSSHETRMTQNRTWPIVLADTRIQKGASPIQIEWTWPHAKNPWISPNHGAIAGHIRFVNMTILDSSSISTKQELDHREAQVIPTTQTVSGVHRLTPLLEKTVFSQDDGEIQRMLPFSRALVKPVRTNRSKTRRNASGKTQVKAQARSQAKARSVRLKLKETVKTRSQEKFTNEMKKQLAKSSEGNKGFQIRQALFPKKLIRLMVVLRPVDIMTFATYGARVCIPLGAMIYQGEELFEGASTPISGQLIEIRRDRVTLRIGQPYRVGWQSRLMVTRDQIVKAEKVLAHLLYFKTKTGDIVQGLPKIEEILEARRKKGNEIIRSNLQDFVQQFYQDNLDEGFSRKYASTRTMRAMQVLILRRVQLVYRSQGVQISDKHLEIISLRMTSRVLVEKAYGTGILPGEIIEKRRADMLNQGRTRIRYCPIVLGITKASLTTKGFISSASFQETTRVLTQAVLQGKSDWLLGLKENVILGRLIPAGVGIYGHWVGPHEFNIKQMLKLWVLPPIITGQSTMRAMFHSTTRYWQDLEAVMESPNKLYPVTPYKCYPDTQHLAGLSIWMPEFEFRRFETFTEEEMVAAESLFTAHPNCHARRINNKQLNSLI